MVDRIRLTDQRWWCRDLQMMAMALLWVNLYQMLLGINSPYSTEAFTILLLGVIVSEIVELFGSAEEM